MQKTDWFKKAIVYSLDVRSFKDGNRDGWGDINGLLSKFDYLSQLGVDCIWIAPFYHSHERDDGYDVIDYYHIDPSLGSMEDFELLVEEAKRKDIKIILDLVVNHTSIDHPWFKKAIEQPDSMYYDYYIWTKQKPENDRDDVMFDTVEASNWEYEPAVSAYFYHTFYRHQPDLNLTNPRVQAEILRIIDFWMEKGIDGFRIDAAPHILRDKGDARHEGDPYDLLDVWRNEVLRHNEDAILIGEADIEPEKYPEFLNGRLTALFNFYINNYIFLSLATQQATPLSNALHHLPLTEGEHYFTFLRNHDELDLSRLSDDERGQVLDRFAPEPTMRIYNRGIRRRLAPILSNNHRQMKLALSLLFSLPGTPVIRYGEEIGMGDDLNLPERRSVRTAMQWSDQPNAGFSDVVPQALKYPLIRVGPFAYEHVNVEAQEADPSSHLNTTKALVNLRKEKGDMFSGGEFMILDSPQETVLAYGYKQADQWLVIFHNFSESISKVKMKLPVKSDARIIPLAHAADATLSNGHISLSLAAYGFSWFIIKNNT
ncbi:alpha-amylase family protein [Parapedobacter deserti]|uniref:Alpha-amylase n=1 Tax=Parapedobacter deserti TaxID=1912957 RepID=A0ABV7JV48_9SPHI